MDERDVKAHNDAIQNERVGTYCRVCLQVVCMCNKFMDAKIDVKAHNRSVQDERKIDKKSGHYTLQREAYIQGWRKMASLNGIDYSFKLESEAIRQFDNWHENTY